MSSDLRNRRAPRHSPVIKDIEQSQGELSDEEYARQIEEAHKRAGRRKMLERVIPVAALALLLAVGWLAYGWAERRGYLESMTTGSKTTGEPAACATLPASSGASADYSPSPAPPGEGQPQSGFSTAQVELYVSSKTPQVGCQMAREFLVRHKIPFTECDIDTDEHARGRFMHMNPQKALPFAIINGRQLTGFNPKVWYDALVSEEG